MSLEPISNDIILKAEKLIKQGATYNQIKEICHISNGTIAKIKQGKITSDRVVKPIYSDKIEKLRNELNLKDREIKVLENQLKLLDWTKEKYTEYKNLYEKYKNLYENLLIEFEKLQKAPKGSQNDFRGTQRNISPVKSSNAFIKPSSVFKIDSESKEDDLMGYFD